MDFNTKLKEVYDIMKAVNGTRDLFDGIAKIFQNEQDLNAFKFFDPKECRVLLDKIPIVVKDKRWDYLFRYQMVLNSTIITKYF